MIRLQNFLSHLCVIGAAVTATLLVVDNFNPSMDFINNNATTLMLAVLCAAVLCLSLLVLAKNHSNRK